MCATYLVGELAIRLYQRSGERQNIVPPAAEREQPSATSMDHAQTSIRHTFLAAPYIADEEARLAGFRI